MIATLQKNNEINVILKNIIKDIIAMAQITWSYYIFLTCLMFVFRKSKYELTLSMVKSSYLQQEVLYRNRDRLYGFNLITNLDNTSHESNVNLLKCRFVNTLNHIRREGCMDVCCVVTASIRWVQLG